MNILLTGGLGVNGAWVTRKLVERGYRPVVLEKRLDLSLLPADVARSIVLVEGDVTDLAGLVRTLADHKIQRVVHMAALITGIQTDLLGGFEVNATGTVKVLEAASRTGVERVVFTSSRAAYGDIGSPHAHPDYEPIAEDDRQRPFLVYDVCKVAAEGMGRNYARMRGLSFVALRFAQIFGPGKLQRHGPYGLFSQLIESPLAGRAVTIPRGGDQRDDLIYVDDAAEAIVLATLHEQPRYDAYNISRGVGTTLRDFADAVRAVIPGAAIEIGPGLDYHGLGANYCGIMDNTRARSDLGFVPRFDLVSGVAHYVATMQELGLQPVVGTPV
jgi:UDP-glucose 4-epimerase